MGLGCTLSIDFSPKASSETGVTTALSELVSVTDNNLNLAKQVQSVAVGGTENAAPPLGFVDQAVDALTHSTTLAQADNLWVSGWAADLQEGAPVKQVQILIVGKAVGNATLGLSRPDVAAARDNPAYLDSGWSFTYAVSGLSLGSHTASAVATA